MITTKYLTQLASIRVHSCSFAVNSFSPCSAFEHLDSAPESESGFTLVELMVVAVLLGLMSVILYGTLNGVIRAKQTIDSSRSANRTAEYLLGQISRELSSLSSERLTISEDGKDASPTTSPSSVNPSASGASSSSTLGKMLGRHAKIGNRDFTTLRFVSTTPAQATTVGRSNSGSVEIEYHLEVDSDDIQATAGEKKFLLVREETPAGIFNSDIKKAHRIIFPLTDNIYSLNFRFLNDKKWQDEWLENNTLLPQAVEINLQLQDETGRILSFKTAVALPKLGLQF